MQDVFIGVDVSMDMLDIAGTPGKAHVTISNQSRDIKRWLKDLPAGACLAMESTGRYHQLLADLAHAAGFHVYILNPKRVWHASRGDGRRAKTDRIDAQVIAKFLREHIADLHEWIPSSALNAELTKLERRRHCIERHATAMHQSLQDVDGLDEEIAEFKKSIATMRKAIDERIHTLIATNEELARKNALLMTVPTIGKIGAASLATLFARVPFKTTDAVVAFVGLDVRARDSGKYRGRRRLTKQGPASIRREVWLMGFVASHTKIFIPFYRALLSRGLPTTAAMMIVGRHILRIAWAVWRTDSPFDPKLVGKQA